LGLVWSMAAVSLLGACTTDAGASFFILQNQVPEDGCVISPSPGTFRSRGTVDVQASAGYIFTPVVQSLVQQADRDDVDRVIFVQGAALPRTVGHRELDPFRQRFSGAITPGGTTSFAFEILPPGSLDGVDEGSLVLAEIEMFGEVEGGDATAEPFVYPIDVCD